MREFIFCFLTIFVSVLADISDPRIVGGRNANSTDHQVSIRVTSGDYRFGNGHICGGSLIVERPNVVVTAAHCMFEDVSPASFRRRSASELSIVTGNINKRVNDANTVRRKVKRIIVHEKYKHRTSFTDDIAVLIIDPPIFSYLHANIKPIALSNNPIADNTSCRISGWGSLYSGQTGQGPDMLQEANVTIIPMSICNATTSYNGQLRRGMLCAGVMKGGIDSCQGDSGGPLACQGRLVGVTSNGNECALKNFPGIYTDVAYYNKWLLANSSISLKTGLTIILICLFVIYNS